MNSILKTILSLAAAGTMMVSTPLDEAAPQHDIDHPLFLINRQWKVSKYYVPARMRQADVSGKVRTMQEEAAAALEDMFAACKEEKKITLTTISGYRSYSTQRAIYNRKLDNVGSKTKADEYVARPGASEHQLGLAMDVSQKGKSNLSTSFAKQGGGKWIEENCWRFGFVIRYQKGWEDVTGYKYEPWHVRYVGKEAAAAIHDNEMPLEDYLLLLREERMLDLLVGEKVVE